MESLNDCVRKHLLTCSVFFIFFERMNFETQLRTIIITFYLPSCRGQETVKKPTGLRVKLPPAHLLTTHDGGFNVSLIAESQEGKL